MVSYDITYLERLKTCAKIQMYFIQKMKQHLILPFNTDMTTKTKTLIFLIIFHSHTLHHKLIPSLVVCCTPPAPFTTFCSALLWSVSPTQEGSG